MVNERKAPELRFDGFSELQELKNLTDVIPPSVGSNTLSRVDLNYESVEIKNIHYGDILVKFGAFVDSASDEIPYITNGTAAEHKSNNLNFKR